MFSLRDVLESTAAKRLTLRHSDCNYSSCDGRRRRRLLRDQNQTKSDQAYLDASRGNNTAEVATGEVDYRARRRGSPIGEKDPNSTFKVSPRPFKSVDCCRLYEVL